MSDLKINGAAPSQGLPQIKPAGAEEAKGFEDVMNEALGKLSQVQNDADHAVEELASGGDPAAAIIAMEKADMDFQLMIEVRNKLINAYQQVMNMQI